MKLSWRDCHNYHGNKVEQRCIKCGRVLSVKDQWADSQPKCTIRDERTLEGMVGDFFSNKIPNPYIHINIKPFKAVKVTLQDLYEGK